MRARMLRPILIGSMLACLTGGLPATAVAQGNPEAAKLKNPVPKSVDSTSAGQVIYQRRCRGCHGQDATGGPPKEAGDTPAANLVDDHWDHGSSDGEIFSVIKNGVPPALVMEPWDDRLSDTDIWNVVNYLRSLAQKK